MTELRERLAQLNPEQIRALAARVRERKASAEGGIQRQDRSAATFPLSFSQQRLWFLSQLYPDSVAYSNPVATELMVPGGGHLDPDRLADALGELVDRHEMLRTTFVLVDGEPRQCIAAASRPPVAFTDLATCSDVDPMEATLALMTEDVRKPFDLENGPLIRVTVTHLGSGRYVVLLNTHHLISDAWSLGVLLRELIVVVMARNAGLPPLLAPLPVQYVDFAAWQHERLQGDVLERLRSYWLPKLAMPLPVLDLSRSRRRPQEATQDGLTLRRAIDTPLLGALKEVARQSATTPFVMLLTVYKLLLRHYARMDDIVVGTPVANRTRSEIEGLIGCFINTLVLRTDFEGVGSFIDALVRVGQTSTEAFAHQEMPFELLVNDLQPGRTPGSGGLFQTLFSMQNAPLDSHGLGASMRVLELETATAKFDLTLTAMETDDGMSLAWTYRRGVLDPEQVERMSDQFMHLLIAAVAAPHTAVADLPLMDDAGRQQILARQPAPGVEGLARDYVSWFEDSCVSHPDQPAVRYEDEVMTYRQLAGAAHGMACRLKECGVEPGDRVALHIERSPTFVVAMLGAMKAGAAFVPLDTSWPAERLARVVTLAGAKVIVSQGQGGGAELTSATLIDASAPWAASDADPAWRAVGANDLAYVIFTSGSTGEPKGVMVEHRHLCHYVEAIAKRLALSPGAACLAVSTLAADLAYTMMFPTLVSGGCLLLASAAQMREPAHLAEWLARYPSDALKIVPSHLDALLDMPDARRLLPKQVLVLGGEVCKPALVQRLGALDPTLRVINHYGPTETTVGVLTADISLADGLHDDVPLGWPLGGARAYICDESLRLLPVGVPGELCLGGPTVARGYVAAAGEAGDAFLPDPHGASDGRMYRTGDLAVMDDDGGISFLGRIDDQVKIRGFRVEPAEVEAAILAWPGARDAAVKAIEYEGQLRLAAWVVASEVADEGGLRTWLRGVLPDPMCPSLICFVPALPRTQNGKTDRRALQAPATATRASNASSVDPRSQAELSVIQLWKSLLERTDISVYDNFFDLGGHSLLAVRMIARIHSLHGISLPLTALFEHPTVERFAKLIAQPSSTMRSGALVPIQQGGTRRPLFFVHPAGGNVLCYYQLSRALGSDQPFYGLQARMFETDGADSITAMASTYVEAMRLVQPHGPYALGGWSMGGVIAFEMACQLRAAGDDIAWLGILDIPAPGHIKRQDRDRIDEATALAIYARKVELFSGIELGLADEVDAGDTASAWNDRLRQAMRRHGLLPEEVTEAQFATFMAVQRAHNYASLAYQPPAYDGPLSVIRCQEPPPVELEADLLGLNAIYAEASLGWDAVCGQPPVIHRVAGNHVQMMMPPYVESIAQLIRGELD